VFFVASVNENGEPNFPERSKHSEDENRESDGLRSGIDEKTSMDDVRAPNVFERAKEEFQALSEVFHHKRKVSASDIRFSSSHYTHFFLHKNI